MTGVSSGRNAELVRSLGANEVIDYTTQDVTKGEGRYDLIFDAVGQATGGNKRILAAGGSIVSVRSSTSESPADLVEVRDRLASGSLRAVIDRRYSLDEIREAHSYVEKGGKWGNVLITVVRRGTAA